jgi:SAM-dependent methyltransferase
MPPSFDPANEAEFDRFASSYDQMHRASIAASGEGPAYFARYKRDVLVRLLGPGFSRPVLDFGCGIGNLTSLLVESLPEVHGYDPSGDSVRLARERAPRALFFDDASELAREHYGAAVLANVLHHVPPRERDALVLTVVSLLAPGGRLVVFEHNPLNPLTRRAVAACAFDEQAVLLWPREARDTLERAGLAAIRREYIVFFPKALRALRALEPRLGWLPAGAQFVVWGHKP